MSRNTIRLLTKLISILSAMLVGLFKGGKAFTNFLAIITREEKRKDKLPFLSFQFSEN